MMGSLRIGSKIRLGFGILIALFLVGILLGFQALNDGDKASSLLEERYQQLRSMDNLKYLSTDLTLLFMDIIIDSESGIVSGERLQALENIKTELKDNQDYILSSADTKLEKENSLKILKNLEELTRIGGYVLIPAVQNKIKDPALYAKLDDDLDNLSNENEVLITSVILSIQEEVKAAKMAHTAQEKQSKTLLYFTLFTGVSIGLIAAFVITKQVVTPLGAEPQTMVHFATQLENGDLRFQRDLKDQASGLYASLLNMALKLQTILSTIEQNSVSLSSASTQLAATSKQVQSAASEINEGIESSSAAITESSANTNNLAKSVQGLAEISEDIFWLAGDAKKGADSGQEAMNKTSHAIGKIEESSKKIGNIVTMITEISNQTNLLSLNAAIEAAKAGEFGKGFAVVADEVRVLAERSNGAVNDIKDLVDISNTNVSEGIEIVKETSTILQAITEKVVNISDRTKEMSHNMEEQKGGTIELDQALVEISQTTETNAAAMTELSAAMVQVDNTITELADMATDLQEEVSYFTFEEKI